MPEARVGMSGWTYAPWRGEFYPRGLRQADELRYAAEKVTSIELNGSFYSLQKPSSWTKWRDETPDGFVFAVKAPRFMTHIRRLQDVEEPLANFLASGILALGPKLGPILWQLPPSLEYDPEVVGRFLDLLPHDTATALEIAKGRSERMSGREHLEIDANRPVRHALEPRAFSFDDQQFADQAAEARVAVVLGDNAGRWPRLDWITADFVYARLHGDEEIYTSGYDEPSLAEWEEWVRDNLDRDRDVYVYFDNDQKVRAPYDAMALNERLAR
ncbi:DUF72 domain-containing protein [Homoserinibacter sp. GY 40078]|uniref:DUF72 domain-containing protein n=1 Tax=Homoserinibacter sp. GY 40078 TaxID=2603275 RepID=UPI0011C773B7|nr:DUF72 domain-containing protein [Homoserinibacter sp. GY 40078]TXK17461.1 DUF72 domain-containing protein [Homoserinibacter sp. GY 40078]